MPNRFNRFVHDENIRNLEQKIDIETDPVRAAMLKARLLEERSVHRQEKVAAAPKRSVP